MLKYQDFVEDVDQEINDLVIQVSQQIADAVEKYIADKMSNVPVASPAAPVPVASIADPHIPYAAVKQDFRPAIQKKLKSVVGKMKEGFSIVDDIKQVLGIKIESDLGKDIADAVKGFADKVGKEAGVPKDLETALANLGKGRDPNKLMDYIGSLSNLKRKGVKVGSDFDVIEKFGKDHGGDYIRRMIAKLSKSGKFTAVEQPKDVIGNVLKVMRGEVSGPGSNLDKVNLLLGNNDINKTVEDIKKSLKSKNIETFDKKNVVYTKDAAGREIPLIRLNTKGGMTNGFTKQFFDLVGTISQPGVTVSRSTDPSVPSPKDGISIDTPARDIEEPVTSVPSEPKPDVKPKPAEEPVKPVPTPVSEPEVLASPEKPVEPESKPERKRPKFFYVPVSPEQLGSIKNPPKSYYARIEMIRNLIKNKINPEEIVKLNPDLVDSTYRTLMKMGANRLAIHIYNNY